MKKKLMQAYVKRAEQIIGKRTPEEIAHDDEVVTGLEMGLPIEAALTNAAQNHPAVALSWDADSIHDIANHFDYLKEHTRILKMAQSKKQK